MKSKQIIELRLRQMSLEQLQALISEAERVLSLRQFEEEMKQAVNEYKQRDPRLIRL